MAGEPTGAEKHTNAGVVMIGALCPPVGSAEAVGIRACPAGGLSGDLFSGPAAAVAGQRRSLQAGGGEVPQPPHDRLMDRRAVCGHGKDSYA
ncbi:hypothetical protein GCM10010505_29340 [Kitasatospora aburaviensis]